MSAVKGKLRQPLLWHSATGMRWLRASHCLGVLLIVLVALIWVAASQLIETIFKDQAFDHPYFLTYFNTCGFTFWLLGAACSRRAVRSAANEQLEGGDSPSENLSGSNLEQKTPIGRLRKYGAMAVMVSPAWLAANYLFNLSLDYTSVASNSMFSTTSNLWTMLFSVCFLGERLNPFHVLAVIFTMAGSALVALADADSKEDDSDAMQKSSWVGDSLALVSACVYGAYTVLLKHCVPEDEERLAMPTLFGCIGLLVLIFGWPFLLLFDFIGWEDFAWPTGPVLGTLVINALIGTNLSDVLWAYAVQLTTPLTATLGLSLTVPFGMISDAVLRGKHFDGQYILGSLLVLCGFLLVSFARPLWTKLRHALWQRSGANGEDCDSSEESSEE